MGNVGLFVVLLCHIHIEYSPKLRCESSQMKMLLFEWIFTAAIELMIRRCHKFALSADEDCLRWKCGHMR